MNMRMVNLICSVLPVACTLSATGCGSDTGQDLDPIPVVSAQLNVTYMQNDGLVKGLGGWNDPPGVRIPG